MNHITIDCFGYCRNCWAKLTFAFEVPVGTTTAKQYQYKMQEAHSNWCNNPDVRLVSLEHNGVTKTIKVEDVR